MGNTNPLAVRCPKCYADAWSECFYSSSGVHKERRKAAGFACRCTNHMGKPKVRHRTREAAVAWAVKRPQIRGMRMEPYRCPDSNAWHMRTARREATA